MCILRKLTTFNITVVRKEKVDIFIRGIKRLRGYNSDYQIKVKIIIVTYPAASDHLSAICVIIVWNFIKLVQLRRISHHSIITTLLSNQCNQSTYTPSLYWQIIT